LTVGEKLILARRRAGLGQSVFAQRYNASRNRYGEWERDEEPLPSCHKTPEIKDMSVLEECFILRRRAGLTQEQCAEEIGVSRFWYNQMEMGTAAAGELLKYWGVDE